MYTQTSRNTLLKRGHYRTLTLNIFFIVAFLITLGRLANVTLLGPPAEESMDGASGAPKTITHRANIIDRNGHILASNVITQSLYANPKVVVEAEELAEKIGEILPGIDVKTLKVKLTNKKRGFVWIARHLTPKEQQAILEMGGAGIYFQKDERRIYPHGPMLAHVLGFTNVDNQGLAGIEQYFEERLTQDNTPLKLSIDIRIQHALYDEILNAMAKFEAIGGNGVVMDVKTGEILAMTSLPSFDPNRPEKLDPDATFNRNTLGVYEMGSLFKILNLGLALESGKMDIKKVYDATHPYKLGRFTIKDHRGKKRPMTVGEIFVHSSNIGALKMALDVGGEAQQAFLKSLHLFEKSPIELPEVGRPLKPATWREATTITVSYGYGVAISPMQMISAIAAMLNGGVYYPPTLLVSQSGALPRIGERIIQEEVSEKIRKLMRLVVKEGTGKQADVKGYLVGGKSGSSEKLGAHGEYTRVNRTTFVAVYPMNNPRYIIFLSLDAPKALKETYGYSTAGWNAAPTAGHVIERTAPLLGIEPVDENDPKWARKMAIDWQHPAYIETSEKKAS